MPEHASATALAHAKLNYSLEIVGLRDDGMHLLNSVVGSISLADRVTATLRGDDLLTLEVIGDGTGPDPLNLALKAATLFRERYGLMGLHIVVEKAIPVGSGMGGGSADAAAVLHLARALSGVEVSDGDLASIGAELGADVPFCVTGGAALMTGIGEVIEPLPGVALDTPIVVAVPKFWMPTSEVYAAWDRAPRRGEVAETPHPLEGIVEKYANDLEPVAESLVPELAKLRRIFSEALGSPARMTGSGSALMGFADSAEHATATARSIASRFAQVLVTAPAERGVELLG